MSKEIESLRAKNLMLKDTIASKDKTIGLFEDRIKKLEQDQKFHDVAIKNARDKVKRAYQDVEKAQQEAQRLKIFYSKLKSFLSNPSNVN